ncbi:MAG: DVU0298 family protein [Longimicrobiales bacterium]
MQKIPLRDRLLRLLEEGKLEEIAELATVKRRVLGSLVALTFDSDLQVAWRAVEAMGMAVEKLAPSNKAYVKEHMRRLHWLITEESGGVFWKAPECMAECAARLPGLFESHVTIAFHLLETLEEEDLEHFRPGALWAIGRLVHLAREDLPMVLPLVTDALSRPDPQARGMAVWCLGEVGEAGILENRPGLLEDAGPVRLYRDRVLLDTTVGRLAKEVLEGAAHGV